MNQILLTKVLPRALTASAIILLLLLPYEGGRWLWITAGVLFALDSLIFIWMLLRRAPNLRITEDAVFICGLKIDRHDIQDWRVFRTASNGERGRYIEIQLKKVPPSPFGWKLAKLFEQAPTSKRGVRGTALAREPRIIAALSSWDLTGNDISNALDNSEQDASSNGGQRPSLNSGFHPRRG
jgi:hypothetical protein